MRKFTALHALVVVTMLLITGFVASPQASATTIKGSAVKISGTAVVGSTLKATTGMWKPKGVKRSYQWYRAGKAIMGATKATYLVAPADLASALSVKVKGTKRHYHSTTKASRPTAAVLAGSLSGSTPSISGATNLGATLTANVGSWGPAPVSFSYQWYRNGTAIPVTNSGSYVLGVNDVGKQLSVAVTGGKAGYNSLQRTSGKTAVVQSPGSGRVMARTQRMSGPTLTSTQNGWFEVGAQLGLVCYKHGQAVKGYFSVSFPNGWDDLWYRVNDGYWVADVDIETGSNGVVAAPCPPDPPAPATLNAGIIASANQFANGAYGGQCLVFAENRIRNAGGPSIAMGFDGSTYQSQWAQHATQVQWAQVTPGDIVQWYDANGTYGTVHTAIITGGNSEGSATVVDSNYGLPLNQELVHRGSFSSRASGFHSGTYKIWRVHG